MFSFSEIVFLVDFIFLTEKCGILATGPAKVTGEHWRPCVLQAGHCDRASHSVLKESPGSLHEAPPEWSVVTFSFRKTTLENLFTQGKGVAVRSFTFLLVDSLPSQAQDWPFSNHVTYTEGKSVLIKSKKSTVHWRLLTNWKKSQMLV